MKNAFSAKRQASKKNGTPCRLQTALTSRMLASETGWPPPLLFVMVIMTRGILSPPRSSAFSSLETSMFPLKGERESGSYAPSFTRLTALAPRTSMLAWVVSKWMLLRTDCPCFTSASKRTRSAARPWCVGMTWGKPKTFRTALSKRKKLRAPA